MPNNTLCSEARLFTIDDKDECDYAVLDRTKRKIFDVKTNDDHPKGCYISTRNNVIYGHFNEHDNGTRHNSSAPICKSILSIRYEIK